MLLPCALEIGPVCGWTPGAATLLLMAIPVSLSGLAESVWCLRVTSLIAVASCFGETYLAGHALSLATINEHVFPICTSILLFCIGSMLEFHSRTSRALALASTSGEKQSLIGLPLTSELPKPVSSVAELIAQTESLDMPAVGDTLDLQRELEAEDPELLLSLQEVGWRVASDLDLDTLYQTVNHTTHRLLRCNRCSVLLWNSQMETLSDPLCVSGFGAASNLRPDRGMTGWVVKNRHLLIHSDIENDPALRHLQRREELHIDAIAPLAAGGELLGLMILEGVDTTSPQFRRMLQLTWCTATA